MSWMELQCFILKCRVRIYCSNERETTVFSNSLSSQRPLPTTCLDKPIRKARSSLARYKIPRLPQRLIMTRPNLGARAPQESMILCEPKIRASQVGTHRKQESTCVFLATDFRHMSRARFCLRGSTLGG